MTYPVGPLPDALVVTDLTGNGIPDIVVANQGGGFHSRGDISVLLGNGDGTFENQQTFPTGEFPPSEIAVADLTGDGQLDIITANFRQNSVSVLLSNGITSFASSEPTLDLGNFQPAVPYAVGNGPHSVAVKDLGNGQLDIVTANSIDNTVSVLLGNGDGTFQSAHAFAVGSQPRSVAVADLTGDGQPPDIVTANSIDNTVSVLLGNGDGTFQSAHAFAVGSQPRSVAVADLTGDGQPPDIVTANYGDNTVSVLLGNGDGTFQPVQSYFAGYGPVSVAVADLNGDGLPDIVTAAGYNTVSVLLGNGDGTFQPAVSYAVGFVPSSVAVADLTGDGQPPDIVTANYGDNTVSVLLGNGDGTFQPAITYAVGNGPEAVAVGEFNGQLGIVTANAVDNTVSVLLGNGDGTFQPAQTYAVGSDPLGVAVADLTGDGMPDIVTANSYDDTVSVLLPNGIPFSPPAGGGVERGGGGGGGGKGGNGGGAGAGAPTAVAPSQNLPEVNNVSPFSVSSPPSASLTSAITPSFFATSSGGVSLATVIQASGASDINTFDLAPNVITTPTQELALLQLLARSTEQDILSGSEISRSLIPGTRPQANLVPQQQDTTVPLIILRSGDATEGADRKGEDLKSDGAEKLDFKLYLISPVENTLIGPVSPPKRATPKVPLTSLLTDNVICVREIEDKDWRNGEDRIPATLPPAPLPEHKLRWELIVAVGVAIAVPAMGTVRRKKPDSSRGRWEWLLAPYPSDQG